LIIDTPDGHTWNIPLAVSRADTRVLSGRQIRRTVEGARASDGSGAEIDRTNNWATRSANGMTPHVSGGCTVAKTAAADVAGCRSAGTQHGRAVGGASGGGAGQHVITSCADVDARHSAAHGVTSDARIARASTLRHNMAGFTVSKCGPSRFRDNRAGMSAPVPEIRRCGAQRRKNRGSGAGTAGAPYRAGVQEHLMTGRHQDSITPLTVVTGVAGVMLGIIVGYMLGVSQAAAGSTPVAAASAPTQAAAPAAVNEQELQAYRNVLATDPKNLRANVELGNRLYDAARYAEAVPYYQQAFVLDSNDVSVSTDLATALYYSGRADDALRQFDKSLAIDPKHGQTLFNLGIVKRDAKNDPKGAIATWERLLTAVPDYSDAAKVRRMIDELKQQTGS
jgi:cytochrome c-type biogenesis protein CcmH/NrfG